MRANTKKRVEVVANITMVLKQVMQKRFINISSLGPTKSSSHDKAMAPNPAMTLQLIPNIMTSWILKPNVPAA